MRTLTITLCLIATQALADVAGTASVIDGAAGPALIAVAERALRVPPRNGFCGVQSRRAQHPGARGVWA